MVVLERGILELSSTSRVRFFVCEQALQLYFPWGPIIVGLNCLLNMLRSCTSWRVWPLVSWVMYLKPTHMLCRWIASCCFFVQSSRTVPSPMNLLNPIPPTEQWRMEDSALPDVYSVVGECPSLRLASTKTDCEPSCCYFSPPGFGFKQTTLPWFLLLFFFLILFEFSFQQNQKVLRLVLECHSFGCQVPESLVPKLGLFAAWMALS